MREQTLIIWTGIILGCRIGEQKLGTIQIEGGYWLLTSMANSSYVGSWVGFLHVPNLILLANIFSFYSIKLIKDVQQTPCTFKSVLTCPMAMVTIFCRFVWDNFADVKGRPVHYPPQNNNLPSIRIFCAGYTRHDTGIEP